MRDLKVMYVLRNHCLFETLPPLIYFYCSCYERQGIVVEVLDDLDKDALD